MQCQLYCAGIRAASQHYLRESHEPGKGMGIETTCSLPGGTVVNYYSGIISDQRNGGNHCLELCQWGTHVVYLDGAKRIPSEKLHVAPMQQVNHKCEENSNCSARVLNFDDDPGGLGLLVLETKFDLAAGVFLSFDYHGDFFLRHIPGNVTPPGYKRIRCACGPNEACPNDRERFENAVRQLPSSYRSFAISRTHRTVDRPRQTSALAATLPYPAITGSLVASRVAIKRGSETTSVGQKRRTVMPAVITPVQNQANAQDCSVLTTGGPALLLFCRHGSLQCRGCQACGATPVSLAGQHQVSEGTQDRMVVPGRSNVEDPTPSQLQASSQTIKDANAASRGSAHDPQSPMLVEGVATNHTQLTTVVREEDGASPEVVVPSTAWMGKDPEGLSSTPLTGVARNTHLGSEVGQSRDPSNDSGHDLSRPWFTRQLSEWKSTICGAEAPGSAGPVAAGSGSDCADEFCSVLTFRQLDGPQTPCPGRNVAEQPYGQLRGYAKVCWQGATYSVKINDEVRAVRGEGSCYLLSIADAARNADSYPEFQARRLRHPDLQGEFKECWDKLVGVSDDRDADGLRTIVYSHLLSNIERFRELFGSVVTIDARDCALLMERERQAQLDFPEPPCLVRKWAFLFLRPSTHVDDRFMSVLLDWLGHRVGVMNLMRVNREQDGSTQFLHVPTADLIPDTAVLLIKVLNIEHHCQSRTGLNHFDRVSRGCPVEFLDEVLVHSPPAAQGSTIPNFVSSDKAGANRNMKNQTRHGLDHGSTEGCSEFRVPQTLLQAEEVLRKFDISTVWGPSQSLSRAERLHRRRALAQDPSGWEWVDAVLCAFPVLAQLRPGQHPVPPEPPLHRNPQRVRVSCDPGRQSVQRVKPTAPKKDPRQRTLKDVWPQSLSVSRQSTLPADTEVPIAVVNGQRTPGVGHEGSPKIDVHLANQSPHVTVPPRQKTLLFRLALIPDPRVVPGLNSWIPGTQGLYPKFAPVATSGDSASQFPVWNVHVAGMRRQQAMFHLADEIEAGAPEHSVFYVAADIWSTDKKGWSLVKIYGAFRDSVQFVLQVLMGAHRAPTRCFYELIREGRPCKAYFDLEVEPGIMDAGSGEILCQQVIKEWACRIRSRWPLAENQCPRCLEVMILDGTIIMVVVL